MVNESYIEIVKSENNVAVYNKQSNGVVVISKYIFELIKNCSSIEDIRNIAKDYDKEDQKYFNNLINVFIKQRIFEYNSKKQIDLITFAITDYCNLHCTHCCYSAKLIDKSQLTEVSVDMNLIKKIVELQPTGISITGGEPLLVKNLEEALNYINKNYKGKICLATNATLITEKNVDLLAKSFDSFDISIDGVDPETCDKIRGKNTFDRVISSIKLLQKNNVKYITVSMAMDDNTRCLDKKFLKLCEKLNVKSKIRAMNLIGRAAENHSVGSESIIEFMKGGMQSISGAYDCPGGVRELFVNSKGEVYPCALFDKKEFKIGSIYDDSFLNKLKWDKNLSWFKAFSEYIPNTREECKNCEVKAFCWNCPSFAKSYLNNNNMTNFKPKCELKKNQILEAIEND